MKKNEVYVLNQPKHIIASLIFIDTSFPLSDKVHNFLGKLCEISDIMFVFSEYHNHNMSGLDKRKFASLYQACCFIDSPGKSLGRSWVKLLSYSRNIFTRHIGYTFSRLSDLYNVPESDIERILGVTSSTIVKPVYMERRLGSMELYNIYMPSEPSGRTGIFGRVIDFFTGLYDRIMPGSKSGMYSIWKSESNIMYFRNQTIDIILSSSENPEFLEMLDTFEWSDPRIMIASVTRRLGIDVLNVQLKDVKL